MTLTNTYNTKKNKGFQYHGNKYFFYIQGESKKTGISGVLADFGNFFFQNINISRIYG